MRPRPLRSSTVVSANKPANVPMIAATEMIGLTIHSHDPGIRPTRNALRLTNIWSIVSVIGQKLLWTDRGCGASPAAARTIETKGAGFISTRPFVTDTLRLGLRHSRGPESGDSGHSRRIESEDFSLPPFLDGYGTAAHFAAAGTVVEVGLAFAAAAAAAFALASVSAFAFAWAFAFSVVGRSFTSKAPD